MRIAAAVAAFLGAGLVAPAPGVAEFPYARDGADRTSYTDLRLDPGETPGDLSGKEEWMYAATPEPGNFLVNGNPAELRGVRGAHIVDANAGVATAWQTTTGRPDVRIAVLDSGIEWNNRGAMRNVRFTTWINPGEAPVPRNDAAEPREPGEDCSPDGPYDHPGHDLNGDGVFNLLDYACDSRVRIDPPLGAGPADMLDPQDVLIAFSDGVDDDGNGYVDDMVGWDFLDDDNDPYDDVQYGHGTGEAQDSVAEADNGQDGVGTCPSCMAFHMRVGDSFIADANRFAAAVTYATDNGALVVQEALGAINNTSLAREAVEYAYRHGVTVIASAADEAAQHNNWPSSLPHVVLVNSVTKYSGFVDLPDPLPELEQPQSYLKFNGCTNFNSKITVAIPSVSCSSDATGRGAGIAGLIHAAALDALDRGKLEAHPGCERVGGEPCAITPNEVRQLMASGTLDGRQLADDVDFTLDPELSCTFLPLPTCTDPYFGRGLEDPSLLPVISVIPTTKRYPARAGHDQFYGWGRANVARSVGALVPKPFADASVKSRIPPEVEITGPDWYDQVDPRQATAPIEAELFARGAGYRCQVLVAPGHYPNNRTTGQTPPGDFKPVPSEHCDGSVRTEPFSGVVANLDIADLRSRFPLNAGAFDGREPGVGIQTASGRPNTAPYGFIVKIVASLAQGPAATGEDRRALYLHRDQDMLAGFPRKLGSDGESSPAFADLDGDNRNELIVATADGFVHAYSRDPDTGAVAELPGWPVRGETPGFVGRHLEARAYASGAVDTRIGGPFLASIAIGDADRDGVPEVFAADWEGRIYGWDASGRRVFEAGSNPRFSGAPLEAFRNVRSGQRNRTQAGFLGSPVLADLDMNDGGRLEIVAAGLDRHVYAFNDDGSPVPGFPVLVVDQSKVEAVDPQTHAVRFGSQAGPELQQGPIVTTPAVGDIAGDERPEIIVGTNEAYAVDAGNEGPWAVAPSSSPLLNVIGHLDVLDFANGRVYAIGPDGDPDEPAAGADPFVEGWPRPVAIAMAQLLPLVGEGINGSPVIAELDCQSGGRGPKVGTIPAAGLAALLNADGSSCLGSESGLPRNPTSELSAGVVQLDRPVLPAVGLPAFGDLGGSQPSFVAPAAGVIRALDLVLNDYQAGGQDFIAAWDPGTGLMELGYPVPVNDLSFLTGPAIGDVGGADGEEIVAGTASMDLVALGKLGLPASAAWPKLTTDWTIATPLLGSFGTRDTDPQARRVVVNLTRSGYVNAYETGAHACAPASSPRFHHDNANSGDFRRDAVLPGVPEDLAADGGSVTFTAPGDDLLCGRAARYEVRTAEGPIDERSFAGAERLTEGVPEPAAPGTEQTLELPDGFDGVVAIRAVDEQGNAGRVATLDLRSGEPPQEPPIDCDLDRVIRGTRKADRIRGTAAGELILGKRGADRIAPRGGADCVRAGRGADIVRARGGGADVIRCGPGRDTAIVDARDVVRGCEIVKRSAR